MMSPRKHWLIWKRVRVWVIEPIMKTVMDYRLRGKVTLLNFEDTLSGEDVVEGFSCPVEQLFE